MRLAITHLRRPALQTRVPHGAYTSWLANRHFLLRAGGRRVALRVTRWPHHTAAFLTKAINGRNVPADAQAGRHWEAAVARKENESREQH